MCCRAVLLMPLLLAALVYVAKQLSERITTSSGHYSHQNDDTIRQRHFYILWLSFHFTYTNNSSSGRFAPHDTKRHGGLWTVFSTPPPRAVECTTVSFLIHAFLSSLGHKILLSFSTVSPTSPLEYLIKCSSNYDRCIVVNTVTVFLVVMGWVE